MVRNRIENALWGALMADALAMPVHWFYSKESIREQFPEGIDGFKAPPHPHPDAFMVGMSYHPDVEHAKSIGRSYDILHDHALFYRTPYAKFEFDVSAREAAHGNATPESEQRYHYHHGLQAGDNTLGASLLRILMRSVISRGGYSQEGFLQDFIDWMTHPRENADPYTETWIRRWFENYSRGEAPENCAEHQRRNWSIGSLGGMVRPLALALLNWNNPMLASGMALTHQQLTHRSETVSGALGLMVPALLQLINGHSLDSALNQLCGSIHSAAISGDGLFKQYRKHEGPGNISDQDMWQLHMTFRDQAVSDDRDPEHYASACYIEHGLPLLLHLAQQQGKDLANCLNANAEVGGDSVHRGMVLGLLLGAATEAIPVSLREGLRDSKEIGKEITEFARIAESGEGHLLL